MAQTTTTQIIKDLDPATFTASVDALVLSGWIVFLYDTVIDSADDIHYIAYLQKTANN